MSEFDDYMRSKMARDIADTRVPSFETLYDVTGKSHTVVTGTKTLPTEPLARITPHETREGLLEAALCKLSGATEVRWSKIAWGDVAVKFRRAVPSVGTTVSYNAMCEECDLDYAMAGREGTLFDMARKVKPILDKLEKEECDKHSPVTSMSFPAMSPGLEKLTAAMSGVSEASKRAAEEIEKQKRALEEAQRRSEETMTGTASETFDAIKEAVLKVNTALATTFADRRWAVELDANVTASNGYSFSISEGDEYAAQRVVFSDRLGGIVVEMIPVREGDTVPMVGARDIADIFSDLTLAVDEIVALNSGWNGLAEMDDAARKLTDGKAAFKKALSEATYQTCNVATEKAVTVEQDEKKDFYERQGAYGLI